MAITQYTEPATVNPSLTDWQNSIARDNASSRGFAEVDLSSYSDGATAPTVAVGSRFDNNGALYVVSGTSESISGIAGIAVSTTFYVYYDVSAGVFLASTTAPTFDKEKRGWYNGNDRALFRIYKDSGGEYDQRVNMVPPASVNTATVNTATVNTATVNTLYGPTYGDIGSFVIAGSSSWSTSTEYMPGTTVSGSSLYVGGGTGGADGGPLSLTSATEVYIRTSDWQNLGLTGTWTLLCRARRGSDSSNYPVGLFVRTA